MALPNNKYIIVVIAFDIIKIYVFISITLVNYLLYGSYFHHVWQCVYYPKHTKGILITLRLKQELQFPVLLLAVYQDRLHWLHQSNRSQ